MAGLVHLLFYIVDQRFDLAVVGAVCDNKIIGTEGSLIPMEGLSQPPLKMGSAGRGGA